MILFFRSTIRSLAITVAQKQIISSRNYILHHTNEQGRGAPSYIEPVIVDFNQFLPICSKNSYRITIRWQMNGKTNKQLFFSYNPSGELLSQEITSAFNLIPRNEQCHCCYPAMIKSCTDVTSGNGSRYSSSCSAQPIHKSSVRLLLYQIKSMWIIRMSINDELCVRRRLFKPTIRRNQNHQHDEDGHSFTAQTTILLLAHLRNRKPTKHLNFVFK